MVTVKMCRAPEYQCRPCIPIQSMARWWLPWFMMAQRPAARPRLNCECGM